MFPAVGRAMPQGVFLLPHVFPYATGFATDAPCPMGLSGATAALSRCEPSSSFTRSRTQMTRTRGTHGGTKFATKFGAMPPALATRPSSATTRPPLFATTSASSPPPGRQQRSTRIHRKGLHTPTEELVLPVCVAFKAPLRFRPWTSTNRLQQSTRLVKIRMGRLLFIACFPRLQLYADACDTTGSTDRQADRATAALSCFSLPVPAS